MVRRCPGCRSYNVRRSASQEKRGLLMKLGALSPYRCRDCSTAFRVVSRRFYIVAALVVTGAVGWALLWLLHGILFLDFFRHTPVPAA